MTRRAKPEPIRYSTLFRELHPDKAHIRMPGEGQAVPVPATEGGLIHSEPPRPATVPLAGSNGNHDETSYRTLAVNSSVQNADRPRLVGQMLRVAELMADGEWRTLATISALCGASECAASARLRDARNIHGWTVERRPVTGRPGLWEYRATKGGQP